MIEALLMALIYIAVLALVVYLVLWVLGSIGIALPPQVVNIVWVIVVIVVILILWRQFGSVLHLPR